MPQVERTPSVIIESLIVIGRPSSGRTSPLPHEPLVRLLGLARRAIFDESDNGIEPVIDGLDALDKRVDHFHGRNVALPQHRSQFVRGSEKQIVRKCHERHLSWLRK